MTKMQELSRLARWLVAGSVVAVVLVSTAVSADETWNRFRGPGGTGVADGPSFPAAPGEGDFAWKVDLPGYGSASPCVWDDRIFTLCGDNDSSRRTVVCLALDDGKQRWAKSYASKPYHVHKFNDYAPSTPAADARRVYVTWATADEVSLLAFTHDGEEVWRRDFGPYVSQHGYGVAPIVAGDLVILCDIQQGVSEGADPPGGESRVIAVHAATGATRWETGRAVSSKAAYSTPFVRTAVDGTQELVTLSTTHGLAALDLATGRPRWQGPAFTARTVASPIQADGLILGSCGAGSGGHYLMAVRAPARGEQAEAVYKLTTGTPYVPTTVTKDGLVYLWHDGGILTCIQAADGETVYRQRLGGSFFASPVIVGDQLFNISKEGMLFCVAAGRTFKLLGKTELGEGSYSTPAVAQDKLILRTFTKMMAVNEEP